MSTGKEIRLKRILGEGGKSLVVAMDHAAIAGAMGYLSNPGEIIRKVVAGGPDSLMLTRGMLRHGSRSIHRQVGIILRVSGGFTVLEASRDFRDRIISTVEDALAYGADGVAATIKFGHEMEGTFIEGVSRLADCCARWGVPLLVETLLSIKGSGNLEEAESLAIAARAAAELGADIIKLPIPRGGDLEAITQNCPVPVLILGGEKMADEELVPMIERALAAGAAGICMGRNVWQRENPTSFVAMLREVMDKAK